MRLNLSSRSPIRVRRAAPARILRRCESRGRKRRQVVRREIKMARPPARGRGIEWMTLGWRLTLGSSMSLAHQAKRMTTGVARAEITADVRRGKRKR